MSHGIKDKTYKRRCWPRPWPLVLNLYNLKAAKCGTLPLTVSASARELGNLEQGGVHTPGSSPHLLRMGHGWMKTQPPYPRVAITQGVLSLSPRDPHWGGAPAAHSGLREHFGIPSLHCGEVFQGLLLEKI